MAILLASLPFVGCCNGESVRTDRSGVTLGPSASEAEAAPDAAELDAPVAAPDGADIERGDPHQIDSGFEERLAELQARLDLSEAQLQQVTPIVRAALDRQRSILSRYGIDLEAEADAKVQLGPRDARRLRKDLADVQAQTATALGAVLTDGQLEEYRRLQEESSQSLRARFR